MQREELILNNKKFLSLKSAARETGYTNDYIGQLCRSGKINSQMIGRTRFVEAESLLGYIKSISNGNGIDERVRVENLMNSPVEKVADSFVAQKNDTESFKVESLVLPKLVGMVLVIILLLAGFIFANTTNVKEQAKNVSKEISFLKSNVSDAGKKASEKIYVLGSEISKGEFDYQTAYVGYADFWENWLEGFVNGEIDYFKNVTEIGSSVTEGIFNFDFDQFAINTKETFDATPVVAEYFTLSLKIYFKDLGNDFVDLNKKIAEGDFVEKNNLSLVSIPNFNFNVAEEFAVTWYRTVSGLFGGDSQKSIVDSTNENDVDRVASLAKTDEDGVNEDEVSHPLETTTVSDSLSLTGQATTQKTKKKKKKKKKKNNTKKKIKTFFWFFSWFCFFFFPFCFLKFSTNGGI